MPLLKFDLQSTIGKYLEHEIRGGYPAICFKGIIHVRLGKEPPQICSSPVIE